MIEGYMTINEISEKWEITPQRVRSMCLKGQIEGASKPGRMWAISVTAKNPLRW